ncbi:MAG: phenylalanine--tRNA ligase subunit alpha [Alphaproteobacteria bacterium CG11_big_fil_rev_8_21_14_0_20_44_7]|nr:MAG: phenylalanine--tRNA ligase subunit alpha [Alphaproteobacteria bacterium CG11_big_fil_rev_8_21_14_0_20_44_7]
MSELLQLKDEASKELSNAEDLRALDDIRVKYLGKKGLITSQMSKIGSLPPEEKKEFGQLVNSVKQDVEAAIESKKAELEIAEINQRLKTETLDVTLPIRPQAKGSIHPISKVMDEISAILSGLRFEQHDGPNIEDDYHNFDALNIPENHPARQMHDTFYMPEQDGKKRVLRTHTSPVQIRAMQGKTPPFRIFSMGRTYRSDSDQTHTPMFHQVEALFVDKNVNFGHLKWTVNEFVKQFFEEEKEMRFRPSYFPFTEPSAEVDIGWKDGKWLEIMGCGMVNPKVLENVGVDPNEYSGFAFGAGIERMAMLKYNIPDLRQFFESDMRWLQHYGF